MVLAELLDALRDTVATLYADQLHGQLRKQGGDDTATDGDAENTAGDEHTF